MGHLRAAFYARDENKLIIPTTSSIGSAKYSNPPANIPINNNGKNTIVKTNFEIPHAAFIPKQNNFPYTPNMHTINNNVNIETPYLPYYLLA